MIGMLPAPRTAMVFATTLLASCANQKAMEEEALTFVASDMTERVPREVQHLPARFISERFLGPPPQDAIPNTVVDAVGLSVATDSLIMAQRSRTVVLTLTRSLAFGSDSVHVSAEWLVFEPERNGFWGQNYLYVLQCASTCVLLRRDGPGYLN